MTLQNIISPREEMLSYETICGIRDFSLTKISGLFKTHKVLPSRLIKILSSDCLFAEKESLRLQVEEYISGLEGFSVSVHGAFQYPENLRQARHPLELIYYRGDIGYLESPCISIVGARKCTEDGRKRAVKLARELAKMDYTIVSGLALGIDTAAMESAINAKGRTIGVIGTPINEVYPKENAELQEKVAREHLLISQVPFYRYKHEPFQARRLYFPQRNETMAALSLATIIVEASDTSGTLTQARACLHLGRKLFILNSCFENPNIKWPSNYEKRGAIRVRGMDNILEHLGRETGERRDAMEKN